MIQYIKKIALWFLLLNKRFFKRYIFLVLLSFIPLLAVGLRTMAKEDSGILKILLYQEGSLENCEIIQQLVDKNGLVQYQTVDNLANGYDIVRQGKADSLWVFPEDLQDTLVNYLNAKNNTVIDVYVREDTIQTKLVREQLYAFLFPTISYELTKIFLEDQSKLQEVGQDKLQEHLEHFYPQNQVEGSLLDFSYLGDSEESEPAANNYLLAPFRGLLAVTILLCGLATTMFYMQDEKDKIFQWMPIRHYRLFVPFYLFTGTLNAGIVALFGLYLSGTFTHWLREILLMLLYLLLVVVFCDILRLLCKDLAKLGAIIPILLIVTIVFCPIFLNLRFLPAIKYLLPVYYYLQNTYGSAMLLKTLLYLGGLVLVEQLLPRKYT